MVGHNGFMRVFWPSDSVKVGAQGTLVGWRNSELDVFVTSILQGVEPRDVERALQTGVLFRNSPYPVENLTRRCHQSRLKVVGVLNPSASSAYEDELILVAYSNKSYGPPQIACPGTAVETIQLVIYDRPMPSKMQYVSLDPIPLALNRSISRRSRHGSAFQENHSAEMKETPDGNSLVEKLRLHTVVEHSQTHKDLSLPAIINQINCSRELDQLLKRNVTLISSRRRRAPSVGERVVESSADIIHITKSRIARTVQLHVRPAATMAFAYCYMAQRAVAEAVLVVVEWRLKPSMLALKDISATAQQVDLRLQQFCYWPIQSTTLRERRADWKSITNSHPEYIRFFNNLWLVANDVILGIAMGSFIIDNAEFVAMQFNATLIHWSLEGLRKMISWLMVNPGGLKLNNELAGFLGDLFLWVIDYWAGCVNAVQPFLPKIIRFIGFTSFGGATMTLSLASDLVSLLTLHIHCFYVASARIYFWQLNIITSLFHLFRGKKRNVLRNRIDSCDYELDQLLLGTILFTLLTFLLPTVIVFYFTFAVARMAIISSKAILDTALAGLNHFPLFALMLRVKDPHRVPGGVRFELRDTPNEFLKLKGSAMYTPTSFIALKSKPLSSSEIFHEYFQFGNRIKSHYLSPGVLAKFATGGFVPTLHRKNLYRLQYSMLPAERASMSQVWQKLVGAKGQVKEDDQNGIPQKMPSNGHVR